MIARNQFPKRVAAASDVKVPTIGLFFSNASVDEICAAFIKVSNDEYRECYEPSDKVRFFANKKYTCGIFLQEDTDTGKLIVVSGVKNKALSSIDIVYWSRMQKKLDKEIYNKIKSVENKNENDYEYENDYEIDYNYQVKALAALKPVTDAIDSLVYYINQLKRRTPGGISVRQQADALQQAAINLCMAMMQDIVHYRQSSLSQEVCKGVGSHLRAIIFNLFPVAYKEQARKINTKGNLLLGKRDLQLLPTVFEQMKDGANAKDVFTNQLHPDVTGSQKKSWREYFTFNRLSK